MVLEMEMLEGRCEDRHDTEELINAFRKQLYSGASYDDIIQGARADLERGFSRYGRESSELKLRGKYEETSNI